MTLRERLAVSDVLECVSVDLRTGKIFWKDRPRKFFSGSLADRDCASWNKKYSGMEAFININEHGYKYGTFMGFKIKAHRIVWAAKYMSWPVGEIDHINGIRTDNRIENLRDVSSSQNKKNCTLRKDNLYGCPGINWHKYRGKWAAQISSSGRTYSLGYFDNMQDAILARKDAETKFGFHENHGRMPNNSAIHDIANDTRDGKSGTARKVHRMATEALK